MSTEIDKYDDQIKKLRNICDENELTFSFRKNDYPIRLIVRPLYGFGQQLQMLEMAEDKGFISPDAVMCMSIKDGEMQIQTSGSFTISKALRTKIEGIFTKLHYFWLQYFFRDLLENGRLQKNQMPVIDEDDEGIDDMDEEEYDEDDETADISSMPDDQFEAQFEALYEDAVRLVRTENKCSASLLQRRLNIMYSTAARLIDAMSERGVIGGMGDGGVMEVLPADLPDDEGGNADD